MMKSRGEDKHLLEPIRILDLADEKASFGVMKDVMNSMREEHLERFLIITDPEMESSES